MVGHAAMGSRTSPSFALLAAAWLAACAPKAPAEAPQPSAAQTAAPKAQTPQTALVNPPPPEVQRVVRQASPAFLACYEAGVRRDRELHGRAVMRFVVAAEGGAVSESTVDAASDLPDPVVLQCIQGEIKKLRFSPPEGGTITVVYPFDFSPADVPAPAPRRPSPDGRGRLAPEIIQQTVRSQFSRFRACYEGGLRRDANLQGRVATRFVIDRDGSVREAKVDPASDLPDQAVLLCVALEFKKLRFPEPEGGIVTVVYPISFSPGD